MLAHRTPARTRKLPSFITFQIPGQVRHRRSPHSSLPTTHHPLPTFFVTPLFLALPYISAVSPLSSAFTHFDRGGWVTLFPSTFRPVDFQTFRHASPQTCQLFPFLRVAASCPSLCSKIYPRFLCFQQLTDTFLQTGGWHPIWSAADLPPLLGCKQRHHFSACCVFVV